jgi:prephenate dehydrogenase
MTGTPIGLVGLGLIGGSLARDLAARGHTVVGADADPATRDAALAAGAIQDAFEPGGDAAAALARTGIVVLATPVRAAPGMLRWLARVAPPHAVLTDVGSTKRSILEAAAAAGVGHRFVGGHPMAGDHRSGWDAARSGLFRGATVWLCTTGPEAESAVRTVEALWSGVEAVPRRIDADEHDRRLAWTSHLPQLVASAVGLALRAYGVGAAELGPGGRDVTRLAASDPAVWTDVLLDNADAMGPAMAALGRELDRLRRLAEAGDEPGLRAALEEARSWKA